MEAGALNYLSEQRFETLPRWSRVCRVRPLQRQGMNVPDKALPAKVGQTEVVPRELSPSVFSFCKHRDYIFRSNFMVITELLERNSRLYGAECALVEINP